MEDRLSPGSDLKQEPSSSDFVLDTRGETYVPSYHVPESFFRFIGKSTNNNSLAWLCIRCVDNKVIRSSISSRSNLKAHIKSRHEDTYELFIQLCQENDRRSNKRTSGTFPVRFRSAAGDQTVDGNNSFSHINIRQYADDEYFLEEFTGSTRLTQDSFDKMVLSYIIESGLPFRHTETEPFKRFVQTLMSTSTPEITVQSKELYTSYCDSLSNIRKTSVTESLKTASNVCVTVSHWSSVSGKGYILLTGHWYEDDPKLMMQHACLGLNPLENLSHPGSLVTATKSIMDSYNICHKVTSYITDGESGSEIGLIDFPYNSDECVDGSEIKHVHSTTLPTEFYDKISTEQMQRVHCAVHRLNMVVSDGTKSALVGGNCGKVYGSVLAKVNASMTSNRLADTTSSNALSSTLIQCSRNWRSQFKCLVRMKGMQQQSDISDIQTFTHEEHEFLHEFIEVFQPVASADEILSSTCGSTAAYLLPTLNVVRSRWRALPPMQYCGEMLNQLIKALDVHFFAEYSSKMFYIAAALHPDFKTHWVAEDDIGKLRRYMREELQQQITPFPGPQLQGKIR